MCYTKSKFVLIFLSALCLMSCWSSRKAVSTAQSRQRLKVSDTVCEQVVVTIFDTVKEVTTTTIRENEVGDTMRMTTVIARSKASTRDRYHDVQEKIIVRTDTMYMEKEAKKAVAVVSPEVDIDKDGNITKRTNQVAQTLKWGFFVILAIIVLILLIQFKRGLR